MFGHILEGTFDFRKCEAAIISPEGVLSDAPLAKLIGRF